MIRGISYDSRRVSPGDLFVALVGAVSDGHDYLDAALELGAAALLVEDAARAEAAILASGQRVPAVAVADSRQSMAPIKKKLQEWLREGSRRKSRLYGQRPTCRATEGKTEARPSATTSESRGRA